MRINWVHETGNYVQFDDVAGEWCSEFYEFACSQSRNCGGCPTCEALREAGEEKKPTHEFNASCLTLLESEPGSPALKHDGSKVPLDLLTDVPLALSLVAQVLQHGAKTYGRRNFKQGNGLERERLVSAALGHIIDSTATELDAESNLPHLAHAVCGLLFELEQMAQQRGIKSSRTPWGQVTADEKTK